MTRYLLECPECEARFDLKAYAPEKRVRCRNCRAVMSIPYAPGDPAVGRDLDPELRKKVSGALSLRKLSLVAGLLALALAGGAWILFQRREAHLESVGRPPDPPALTLENSPALLHASGSPLGRGFLWEYAVTGGGVEVREVLRAVAGPDGEPEFEFLIRGSSQAAVQTLRVGPEGVRVAAESSARGRIDFDTPVLALPHPLYSDSAWTQAGEGRGADGARAAWSVQFRVVGVDKLQTPAGSFDHAVRISAQGTRAGRAVEETLWIQRGTGLVKRSTRIEGRDEEAVLRRFVKR